MSRRVRLLLIDEVIPYEVDAELNDGVLPGDVKARHYERARELGLLATNMPAELGGGGYTMLQQVLVQEQVGRATNALGDGDHAAAVVPARGNTPSAREVDTPGVRGEASECYAITEEEPDPTWTPSRRRPGRRKRDVLNGVKWHVTSYNDASYAFFQAKLTGGPHAGEHAMFIVDLPTPGVRVVRTPAYPTTIDHHHPIVAFEDVRVPASHLVGAEGGGMVFRVRVVGSRGSWSRPDASAPPTG